MRHVNPDNIKWWFDMHKLKALFMYKGYENYAAPLARILFVQEKTARAKMNSSNFSHEETITIAQKMGFTLEQYEEIFLKDVFKKESTPE